MIILLSYINSLCLAVPRDTFKEFPENHKREEEIGEKRFMMGDELTEVKKVELQLIAELTLDATLASEEKLSKLRTGV
jgi:hypothetical protein